MTRLRWLAGLCLLTVAAPAFSQVGGVARVNVRVPRDARLYVDDVFCPLPGETRSFDSPPIDPGRKYYYTLTVEITNDGKPVRVSRRAIVQSGQTTDVDFGDRAAIIAIATLKQEKEREREKERVVEPPEKVPGDTSDATPELPKTPGPTQALATLQDGTINLIVPVFVWEVKKVPYEVEKDGMKTTAYKEVKVPISKLMSRQVSLRDAKVIDASGRPVLGETLTRRLGKVRVVLLSEQEKIDPFYLSTLKPGTLIVLAPADIPKPPDGDPIKPPPMVDPKPSPDARPQGAIPLLVEATLEGNDIIFNQPLGKGVVQVKVDSTKAQLSTVGGKPVPPGDLKRYLSDKPSVIVVSSDFQLVAPFHLQLFEAETLVVVPPLPMK
jgi:uncharacterized protein (TIGR03000 family)